ncbi:ATP-dependent helicase [Methanohalophilus halophilus]|uniref:DNA 3'-5' helicase n=1 Tax=Methanohalophilus halophilus TaxID=2177 RepID=A0A1L3Q239_9EURY|nr:ATP-dependent DNA helicase [Methanohalophilus halophilus]APH38938.1 hypothetical protein BHR79_05170 [Methanohalophilus halophilus]RNI07437.1 ATP-dependent helicase [Methanohalophilus halophilus]SDW65886.1 DNA helicase-2 / ATP-dependent DNA helicase PcrA [Methanohalophilus halophilus]
MNFTDNQLKAINHKEGNLKIVACAGSGKTTVMAERIAKLVSEGADRDKIVAFTYTDKAADSLKFNIREKLEKWSPDEPHLGGMYIGTIHSFAFKRLRDIIPKYRSYEVLDEVKRIIWVHKYKGEIGLDSIRKDKLLIDSIKRFLNTVDIIRDNQIPAERLNAIPDFMEVYENYLNILEREKYLDFSGILHKLVSVLESNSTLLTDLKESIDYLVVDEYQDVNKIQEKLIYLMAGENGNLCVVGDDDQSIFEFQGADVNNILQFENKYCNVTTVKLEENFRCPEEVIEASRDLVKRNRNRITKRMVAGNIGDEINKSDSGDLYKVEFDNQKEESSFIIDKINDLRGCEYKDEDVLRGLDYGDMAIIVRSRLSAQHIVNALREQQIPFTFKGTGGLFERPEIKFIQAIFYYIADYSFSREEPPVDLNHLRNSFESLDINHLEWGQLSQQFEELKSYIKSITPSNPIAPQRRTFLQEFYYQLMGILEVDSDHYSEDLLYDFGRFSKLVAEFESIHGWINYGSFIQFVTFLAIYAQNKTDEGGIDDPRNTNSVNVLTIHQAKGLEFPLVFIPDVSTGRVPSRNRNRKPKTHFEEGIIDLDSFCSGDEGERRLFYVATTRTKKFLFMARAKDNGGKNLVSRSKYYTEFDHEIMEYNNKPDPTSRNKIEPQCKPNMELMPTSFTDIRHYIECPYRYRLQQMMGFSPVINLAYGYGLQVHNLLNYIHKTYGGEPPSLKEIESLVESDFFLRFTRGEPLENMKRKCKEIISNYIEEYNDQFELKLETEKPFEFPLEGALISGEIDLIQKIDPSSQEIKNVSIIDFKTEKEDYENFPLLRMQLRLYAIAGSKSLGLNPLDAGVHFLTNNVRRNVSVNPDKLDETRGQVADAITNIKRGNFIATPNHDKCKNCDVRYVCSNGKCCNGC